MGHLIIKEGVMGQQNSYLTFSNTEFGNLYTISVAVMSVIFAL